jgi:hypothetical protein
LITGYSEVIIRGLEVEMSTSGVGNDGPAIFFEGELGGEQILGANVSPGSVSIVVPDGSLFSIDSWAYISSLSDFSSDAKTGELLKIKAIAGNTISLYGAVLCNYLTSDTAKITPVQPAKDITLEDVKINGNNIGGNGSGARFRLCENVLVSNLISNQFQYSHIVFDRCMNSKVEGGFGSKTGTSIGLNYGIAVINACYMIEVDGYTGDSMRHVMTIGGSQGVSRFISGINCKGYNITDAGMDAHSSVHEHTFDNNQIHFSTGGSAMDGIISQGSNAIITNNHLFGVKREGILWQPLQKNSFTGGLSCIISDNKAINPLDTGTGNGVLVSTEPSGSNWASIDSVIVSNFQGSGFLNNVQILARNAEIRKVTIAMAVTLKPMRGRSILAKCTNSSIDQIQVLGGHHETNGTSTNPVIEFEGTEANKVKNWNVSSCVWKRSNTGIGLRLLWTENGWETGNVDIGISTKILSTSSTGAILDTRGGTNFNHITQTVNHAGVFQPNPQHSWDMGGSANIPYGFAYRINGERTLQKDGTSKDIFMGQVDAIAGETGRVILRARGQNAMFVENGSNIGFGIAPSGANYHFNGTARIGTVSNASGEFATFSGSNVLQKRTAAQVRSDIGAIPEAPNDGNKYVRRNNAWEILP